MPALVLVGLFAAFLLFASVPVAAVVFGVAVALNAVTPIPVLDTLGITAWTQSNSATLVAIPLYILFGEIMVRSGIAGSMYASLAPWLTRVPGKLIQTNIATSAVFAATSGSSVATAATIGSVALPEIEKGRYNERIFLGSIAAGGTLGILIPPSINMIIYGVLTSTSIPKLYIAGIVPGLILAGLFMAVTALLCLWRPHWGGAPIKGDWSTRLSRLPALLPPALIVFVVIGSIYAGLATATEAAALGVVAALILAAARKRLSLTVLNEALVASLRTTAMLLLILIAANFLNFVLGFLGASRALETWVLGLDASPYVILTAVLCFYLLLGCFLDGLSMMVLTVPVLAPIMVSLGFDPIWFGIIVILAVEAGLITPPVGMNCYVVQGVRGRGDISDVFAGVFPYLSALIVLLALIVIFPALATWLPNLQ